MITLTPISPIKWKTGKSRPFSWKERGKSEPFSPVLPAEQVITIYLNNKLLANLLATPVQVKEMIAGFLYAESIIDNASELKRLTVNQNKRKIQVWIETDIPELSLKNRIITSGCGRGLTFLCPSDLEDVQPLNSGLKVTPEQIINLMKKMLSVNTLYQQSGGIHCAVIADTGEIISFSEDIGRHNAVDKVLGDCLLRNIDPAGRIMLTSGRISSEMLLKSFRAKIPLVGSLTSPTNLTVELAEKLGITVVGYIRGGGMKIYTHHARLLL